MLFQTSLGIAMEETFISMVYLRASFKGIRLAAYSVHPLDKEMPVEEKGSVIVEFVKGFIKENRIATSDIFLTVPRETAIIRTVELPLAVKENLRQTLVYEIEKYVPFSADDIYFDYQIIAEDKENKQLRVLLAVVKKASLDVFIGVTSQLGSGISGIEIHPTALTNVFSWDRRHVNGDAHAVIYLKDNNLEVSLIKDKMLGYTRFMKLPEGRHDLHGLILKELKHLKEGLGPDSDSLDISFCGSDADFESIRTIEDEAGFEVHQVYYSSSGIPSHDLVSAYGVALKGIQKVSMDINILPLGLRKKVSRVSYYTMFVLALLLILSIVGWSGGGILRHRLTMNRVNAEMERLGSEILSVKQVQKRYKKLEEKADYLDSFRGGDGTPINVLKDLTRRIPESASLTKFNYSEKGIEIEGTAGSASALIPLLEASPLFRDVAFLSSITKSGSKEKFRIGLKLRTGVNN